MTHLNMTTKQFKEKIYDFEKDQNWQFSGPLPVIIDFYADWCAPCKKLEPVMEELSNEYTGLIDIYKVNIDEEKDLVGLFGIQSVPALLFIPLHADPFIEKGALPKYILKDILEEQLLLTSPAENNDEP